MSLRYTYNSYTYKKKDIYIFSTLATKIFGASANLRGKRLNIPFYA